MKKYMILGCRTNGESKTHPMLMACYWLKDDESMAKSVESLVGSID